MAARPLQGYGPGTNADAIAPFLTGSNMAYRGLTSHSTWLRTGVEMGILGLGSLLGFVAAASIIIVRRVIAKPLARVTGVTTLLACVAGLAVGQLTETLLLGGLTFGSLVWAMAIGVLIGGPGGASVNVRSPSLAVRKRGVNRRCSGR
jgi:O-antigen ligase